MPTDLLLDTNAASGVIRKIPAALSAVGNATEVYLPSIALGELFYGANHAGRPAEQLARVEEFERDAVVLECDRETARVYGSLKCDLRLKGKMIPDNDIWIAALARQHGLTVLTNDGHFGEVEGLAVVAWQEDAAGQSVK